MNIVAIEYDKKDNPDLPTPYIIDTDKMHSNAKSAFENPRQDTWGQEYVDLSDVFGQWSGETNDWIDSWEEEKENAMVSIFPVTVNKILVVWTI